MSQHRQNALSALNVTTLHYVSIEFYFKDDFLHDDDYKFSLDDNVTKKITAICQKYGVDENPHFCCQCEGYGLQGEDNDAVAKAGEELAICLASFEHITFI